eukprot:SAG11_NODE_27822_length_328_cov_1.344978_1_plen_33_part_10
MLRVHALQADLGKRTSKLAQSVMGALRAMHQCP